MTKPPPERPSPETERASGPAGDTSSLAAVASDYGLDMLTEVPPDALDPGLVKDLPVDWARRNFMLPVRVGGRICALTCDPGRTNEAKYLSLMLGDDLVPVLAERQLVLDSIERCYYSKQETAGDFIKDMSEPAGEDYREGKPATDDLLQASADTPVTQLTNLYLLEAVKANASDIHFEPFTTGLRVRFRIDGMLYDRASPPKHMEPALISRLKIMAHLDIAEKRLPQDGVARVRVGEREIDLRVSTVPVAEGERVVLRILNRSSTLMPLSGLGMPDDVLTTLESLLKLSHGIIIVCGPTGSGKTTTLYAALQQLDTNRTNVMTIEDPIEYQIPNIGQIQVKPKIGLDFASGLRHILRQDPDVILLGEIRDLESAEIAVRASLTGHMVLTTLHTNDACSAVTRLIDMGIESYLLASSLQGVLAQRLVRTLCPDCREQTSLEPGDMEQFTRFRSRIENHPSWAARGCKSCLDGFKGRTGIFELMPVNAEIQDFIRTGQVNAQGLLSLAGRSGMKTLLECGIDRVIEGKTTISELARTAGSLEEMKL